MIVSISYVWLNGRNAMTAKHALDVVINQQKLRIHTILVIQAHLISITLVSNNVTTIFFVFIHYN